MNKPVTNNPLLQLSVQAYRQKGEIAMKEIVLPWLTTVVLKFAGYAGTTPIKNWASPPVSRFERGLTV